ncbi:MAG TPA: hypothetical protein DCF33_16570 [Saprospirales bacterium]|nr:hypothetical protein [Saprospirales bacterium]
MLDSSLVETLSRFDTAALERFHKFVQSPFFNDGSYARDVTALWDYLRPFAPDFPAPGPSIEAAYAFIYPEKHFVNGKVEVLMSKLHQLAKQFAAHITEGHFTTPAPLRLAEFYLNTGLPNRAENILEKLRAEQSKQPVHDAPYWATQFLIEWQTHRLDNLRQNNHDHESLHEALRVLHHGYLILALEFLNSLFFSRRKSNVEDHFAELMADGIPAAVSITDLETEPVLRLLSRGFEFVRFPEKHDQSSIEQVLNELQRDNALLPRAISRTLFAYLRNHCTWRYNQGDTSYASLLLNLFKSGVENGMLFEDDGQIQASTLLNLVQTGLVCGEYEWVKSVLDLCRNRIVGVPNPDEFFNYNLANYYYHLKQYDTALDLLQDSSDNMFSGLMARKLELKIYYETDSILLDSKIDNFKLFIFRQRKKNLAENVYQMNNAFIDMLRRITASGMMGNPARVEKLKKQLAESPAVAERVWLQEQLRQLGKK